MIIYLPAPVFLASSNQLAAFQKNWGWTGLLRRRSQTAATVSAACDDTRGSLAGRLPLLCFVLHRMGFFVPRELLRERLALTSPFHPFLRFAQSSGCVFSVTLSFTAIFQRRRPRIFRGLLLYGVRTFLLR